MAEKRSGFVTQARPGPSSRPTSWQRTYSSTYDVALQGLSIGADDRLSVWPRRRRHRIDPHRIGADSVGGAAFIGDVGLNQFVARYDNTGQLAWSHDLVPAEGTDTVYLGAFKVDNEVVIGGRLCGAFVGTLDLGDGPLKSIGKEDLFIHRFHP